MCRHGVWSVAAEDDLDGLAELEWVRVDHTESMADGVPRPCCRVDILSRVALDAFDLHSATRHGFSDEAAFICFLQWVL